MTLARVSAIMSILALSAILSDFSVNTHSLRSDNEPNPIQHLLLNGRDVVIDTLNLIVRGARKQSETEKDALLDTTYDDVGSNFLLDIKILFENYLSDGVLKDDPEMIEDFQSICDIIHKSGIIKTTQELRVDNPNMWLLLRSKVLIHQTLKELGTKLNSEQRLELYAWIERIIALNDGKTVSKAELVSMHKLLDQFLTQKFSAFAYGVSPSLDTLKFIFSQNSAFSGNLEYFYLGTNQIHFYMKHFGTMIDTSERKYTDPLLLSLPIKGIDTRTYKGGLQTIHNLFNGVELITDHHYEFMPLYFKELLILCIVESLRNNKNEVNDFSDISNMSLNEFDLKESINKRLHLLWNSNPNSTFRADLFVNFAKIPWSDEIRKGIKSTSLTNLGGKLNDRIPKFEFETSNYAGVKLNLMFSPNSPLALGLMNKKLIKAFNKYEGTFEPFYPENKVVIGGSENRLLRRQDLISSYQNSTNAWYLNAYQSKMPIVGGLSGTTLRSLNLYQAALTELKKQKRADELKRAVPLTRLRFILLGFLTGASKHHSYDEVYSQSHAMPDPSVTDISPYRKTHTLNGEAAKVIYHKANYSDAFLDNERVSNIAKRKTLEFINSPNPKAEDSVIGTLNEMIKRCLPENQFELISDLREATADYIKKNFSSNILPDSTSEHKLLFIIKSITGELKSNSSCTSNFLLR